MFVNHAAARLRARSGLRVLATLGVLATLAAVPSAASADQIATHWRGANVHSLWYAETPAQMHADLDAVKQAGANVVRLDVAWATLDSAGSGKLTAWYSTKLRDFMSYANQLNIKVVAILFTTPCWASSAPPSVKQNCNGDWWARGVGWYPPSNPQDFADFTRYVTSTYASSLAAVEIWNEPDQSAYLTAPDPVSTYAALLKAAYPAAKAANSSIPVLAGSLAGADLAFLQGLYQAGIQGYYDGIAVHSYCAGNAPGWAGAGDSRFECAAGLQALHAFQAQHGDTTPIWVTEFGWNTVSNSPADQAAFIQQGYRILAGMPYVQAGIVYELHDDIGGASTDPEANFGMLDQHYTPKPAYAAFTAVMTAPGAPVLTGPGSGAVISAPTPTLSFTAAANSSVAIYVDGTLATHAPVDGSGNGTVTLTPLGDGPHSISLIATDPYGNVGPASQSVTFSVGPAAPTSVTPQNGVQTTAVPTLSFTAPAGTALTAYLDGVAVGTVGVDGAGHAQLSLSRALADGSHSVYATDTDSIGLTSPASPTASFTVLPPAPAIQSPQGGSTGAATTSVQISGVAGNVAKVCIAGISCSTATLDGNGRATLTITGLRAGQHTVRALQIDREGLSSDWTPITAWTVKQQHGSITATAASAPAVLRLGVQSHLHGGSGLRVVCRVRGTAVKRCHVAIYRNGRRIGSATVNARHAGSSALAVWVHLSARTRAQLTSQGATLALKASGVAFNGSVLTQSERVRVWR